MSTMETPLPLNEPTRLEALRRYHILDTAREQEFDDLVWLAAQICEMPIALVSLVDQHRLWFKGRYGLEATETPRHDSFCAHAIVSAPRMLIVPDATKDERFLENDLVKGHAHIRAYAGAPLITPEGLAIGTLCVLDQKPHELTEMQKDALRIISGQVMNQLELRRRLTELKRASDKLLEANAELEGFSHAISHDLRTPLRAMTSFAQLLRARHARQLDERGSQLLEQIEQSGERTAETLDAFLRLLRLRKSPLNRTGVDMGELVESVLHDLELRLSGPPATIQLDPLPPAHGDKELLRQVWVNLISNAMKFTRGRPQPRIEIDATEEPDRLVYFVKDNGIGFDVKDAEQLWAAFRRLHGEQIEVAGVGLSIVQRIVARHGGSVWAEGVPNQGATFYFALPRVAMSQPASEAPSQQAA